MMTKIVDREILVKELNAKFGPCAELFEDSSNQSVKIKADMVADILEDLKKNSTFKLDLLMNLSSVDYPENFTVLYHLNSLEYLHKLTVKVELAKDNPQIPSVTRVWSSANAMEREVYDLMGIVFTGHPNLKRILLTDDFIGHPLRKDFVLER